MHVQSHELSKQVERVGAKYMLEPSVSLLVLTAIALKDLRRTLVFNVHLSSMLSHPAQLMMEHQQCSML